MNLEAWDQKRLDLRRQLLEHPLFTAIRKLQHLRIFMEAHAFAVWDFMSLLKRLQMELTGTTLPWTPRKDAAAARLINEIVLGEETDVDTAGSYQSHFELYLAAMDDMNADTGPVRRFVGDLQNGKPWLIALTEAECPNSVKSFTQKTLQMACEGSREEVLGAFFYGREELIPNMFQGLLDSWSLDEASAPRFAYYIKRHIQLDRDEHGPAAERLLEQLLGSDQNARAKVLEAACGSIEARLALWDAVLANLEN